MTHHAPWSAPRNAERENGSFLKKATTESRDRRLEGLGQGHASDSEGGVETRVIGSVRRALFRGAAATALRLHTARSSATAVRPLSAARACARRNWTRAGNRADGAGREGSARVDRRHSQSDWAVPTAQKVSSRPAPARRSRRRKKRRHQDAEEGVGVPTN